MRTVAGPAGRPGMAIGVEPASRSLTNTRAPAGRDCTLSPPAVTLASPALAGKPGTILFVGLAAARRLIVVEVVGRRAVNCSVRSSATYPSRATRMVYDPNAKSRSASGVFPRGFPFTSTSASAGVDRISTLPVCVRRTAPDAGARDGLGATGATGCVGCARCDRCGGRQIDDRFVDAGFFFRCGRRGRRSQKESNRQRGENGEDHEHRDDWPAAVRGLWLDFVWRLQRWRRVERRDRATRRDR